MHHFVRFFFGAWYIYIFFLYLAPQQQLFSMTSFVDLFPSQGNGGVADPTDASQLSSVSSQTATQTLCETTQQYEEDEESGDDPSLFWGKLHSMVGFLWTVQKLGPDQLEYTFGRRGTCDFQVRSKHVSGDHCKLFFDPNQKAVYILDTSSNGTFVNGTRLAKNRPRRLNANDVVSLCTNGRSRPVARTPSSGQEMPNFSLTISLPDFSRRRGVDPNVTSSQGVVNPPDHAGVGGHKRPTSKDDFDKKYEMREPLGEGNFGSVNKCVDRRTGITYAVKAMFMNKQNFAAGSEDTTEKFMKEADAMKLLGEHKGIVSLVDIYPGKQLFRIVMDYVDGGDLFNYMVGTNDIAGAGPYREADGKVLMKNILEPLQYAHAKGFAHRDLKPENILLFKDNPTSCKIADWGVAKQATVQKLKTVVGTPMYIAPQVLQRSNTKAAVGSYTLAADMWSVGIIMYVLFTMEPPFDAEAYVDFFKCPPINFRHCRIARLSGAAQDLLRQLLEFDDSDRIDAVGALQHPWFAM